ncbi:hypothetical protein AX774_g3780 [Zancudomyces culisetae]|uniref:Uncharacterized protein n=1 Tax=Zancudomyces culisetae TaxID=1213189 RepID=A0A1R1PPC2_ZANCU|nr:hypothetical protein AX774_g8022 [Zancudomyces culisetae]OMH82732.1 hypothetical protein AX774_g3780 [Zancudomyces culisetae]|eukprot:OMH78583.1 hypothetical protein AX774_g8022 [Zancudomyces culisetae]
MNIGGGHQMFGGSGALDVDDRALERYFGVMETEIENVRLFEPMMKNVEELIEYSVRLSINNLLDRLKEYDLKENSFLPFQTIDNVIFEVKRNPMFINKATAIVVGYNKIINLFVELNRKINAKFGTKYKESTERSKNFGLKLYMQSPIMTGGHHSGNVERSGDGLVQLFLGISEEIEMIIVEHLNYLLGSVSSSVIQMMGKLLVISDGKQTQQDKATRNESGKNVTNELSNEFTKNYAMFFSNMEAIYGLIIAELLKKTKVDSEPLSKVVLLFVRVQIKSFLTSVSLAYPLTEDLNLELVDACSQYEFQTTQLFLSLKTTHLNTKGSNKTLVQQSDFTSLTAGLKEFKQLLFLPNDMLAVGSDKSIGGFKNIQNYIVAFHIASRIFTLITNSHSDSPDINTPISTLFGPWSFYDWLENDDSESGDSTNDQNPVFVNVYFPAVVLQDRSLSLPSILPLLLDSPSDSPSLSQTPGSKSMDGVDSFGASSQAQSRRMASKDYLKESAFYNSEKVVYLDEKSDQYHLESSIVRVGLEKNIRNLIGLVDSIDASKIVGIKQCIDLLTNLL